MADALSAALGRPGETPRCRTIGGSAKGGGVEIHWWALPVPDDRRCYCGERVKAPDDDGGDDG